MASFCKVISTSYRWDVGGIRSFAKGVTIGGAIALAIYAHRRITLYYEDVRKKKYFEEKCNEWPQDVVILHGMRRGKLAPHPSPFVLKLETFLRMHEIPYIFESEFPKGDKAKMPWITLNKEHFTDSQLIIDHLTGKFNVKQDHNYDLTQKAHGSMARIVMEEHFFWGLLLWRYVYADGEQLFEIFHMTPKELEAFRKITCTKYTEFSWYQGIGRHSRGEVIEIVKDDLRVISRVLGTNKFLLGEEPCDDDCAVFGMLAQVIWNDIMSPYTALITNELPNLKGYCTRMKEKYWPDWDTLVTNA